MRPLPSGERVKLKGTVMAAGQEPPKLNSIQAIFYILDHGQADAKQAADTERVRSTREGQRWVRASAAPTQPSPLPPPPRPMLQARHRGVARSEVVDRQMDADVVQIVDRRPRAGCIDEQRRFRDLERQRRSVDGVGIEIATNSVG